MRPQVLRPCGHIEGPVTDVKTRNLATHPIFSTHKTHKLGHIFPQIHDTNSLLHTQVTSQMKQIFDHSTKFIHPLPKHIDNTRHPHENISRAWVLSLLGQHSLLHIEIPTSIGTIHLTIHTFINSKVWIIHFFTFLIFGSRVTFEFSYEYWGVWV